MLGVFESTKERMVFVKQVLGEIRDMDDKRVLECSKRLFREARTFTGDVGKSYLTKLCMMVLNDPKVTLTDKKLEIIHRTLQIEELKKDKNFDQSTKDRINTNRIESLKTMGLF